MRIENLQNENRKYAKSIENFHVLEYVQDASVSPMNAMNEYFMSKMHVRRRQVVIDIDKDHSARSLICAFLQQIHLRNFHFSQLHKLKNFNYFHIGFLYQIQSATSHPAFDHRGLSIDTPSISYL